MHCFLRSSPFLAALFLVVMALPVQAQAPAFDRAVTCTASPGGYAWGPKQLAVDGQGNTFAAGQFGGTAVLGSTVLTAAGTGSGPTNPAPPDVFVAKLNATGNYAWAAQTTGTLWEDVAGVAVDAAGNVYVTGSFESYSVAFGGITLFNSSAASEVFVAKLNGATGQWLWARRCGGSGPDNAAGIAINAFGEVVVAGKTGGASDYGPFTLPGNGYAYAFIAKLSATGTWLWAQQTATGGFPTLSGMVIDGQGNIYMAGAFGDGSSGGRSRSLSFGTTTLTTYTPGTQNNYPSTNGSDLFVAKFTDAGSPLWAIQGDHNGQNIVYNDGLTLDGAGHLYIVGGFSWQSARLGGTLLPNLTPRTNAPGAPIGQFTYSTNAYIGRLNTNTGAWEWVVRVGDAQGDAITAVAADGPSRIYAGGYFTTPLSNGSKSDVAQLDGTTGTWSWARPAFPLIRPGSQSVAVEQLAVDGSGRLLLAGWFSGAMTTFGTVTLVGEGGPTGITGYLARLANRPLGTKTGTSRAIFPLQVWPNPSVSRAVWVQGPAAGQTVQVIDALGKTVYSGQMPTSGPLGLTLPTTISAGLYIVRSTGQAQQLVVE